MRLAVSSPRRLAESGLLIASALAWLAHIATESGAPRLWLTLPLAAAAILGLLAVLLRGRGPAPRWIDGWRLVLVLAALYFLPTVYPRLRGDGTEYYALLRSPLLDNDVSLANDYQGLGVRPAVTPEGEVTSRVAIGQALLWLPPFLVAHFGTLLASALGAGLKPDGFAVPYQAAVTSATFAYGILALLLIEAFLRRLYGRAIALLTTLALWLTTPVHFYLVGNPFMSHGTSILLATAFVLAWLRARTGDDLRAWALAGLFGGLTALVRPQDAVLLALPAIDLLWLEAGWRRRGRVFLALAAAPCLLGAVQIAIWLRLYGLGFAGTVAEQNWLAAQVPQWADLLISPRHGLFTWTPIFLVAVLGWIGWWRRDRRLMLLFVLGLALAVIANAAMIDWWGSQSFGQRRLLSLVPLFALGLAEAIDFTRRKPLVLVAAIVLALIFWNQQFLFIYNTERVAPRDGAITLKQLSAAEAELAAERVLRSASWLPAWLWTPAYDNLKGLWLDAEPRSLGGLIDLASDEPEIQAFLEEGWYAKVQSEGDLRFRHSRGDHSALRVPIKTPACFLVSVRARSEMAGTPVTVALAVNGAKVGEAQALLNWSDLEFDLAPDRLRSGLNEIILFYSTTPRAQRAEAGGRDNALSLASIRFRRLPGPPCPAPAAATPLSVATQGE